jgi:hypothetical protein
LPGQTGAALAARRDRADQDSISDFVSAHARANLINYTNGLVPDDEAGFDRILSSHNVQIRTADRRQCDPNNSIANGCMRPLDLFNAYVIFAMKNIGLHFPHFRYSLLSPLDAYDFD